MKSKYFSHTKSEEILKELLFLFIILMFILNLNTKHQQAYNL